MTSHKRSQLELDAFPEEEPPSIGSRPTPVVPMPAWSPDDAPPQRTVQAATAPRPAAESGQRLVAHRPSNDDDGPLIEVRDEASFEECLEESAPSATLIHSAEMPSSESSPSWAPVRRSPLRAILRGVLVAAIVSGVIGLVGWRASKTHAFSWAKARASLASAMKH